MTSFLTLLPIAAIIICLAVLGMATGVLLGRRPLNGGCGGKGLGGGLACGPCGIEEGTSGRHD